MAAGPERTLERALETAQARLRPWLPRLPGALALVCAIGAGFAGARLVWLVHDLISPPPPSPMVDARTLAPTIDPAAAAQQLAATQAFGPLDATVDAREAPDSRLALKLRGVISAADPRYSRAFIASNEDDERGYPIGATLPGGAMVQSILPDRVVLARNGSLETLRLPRESGSPSETAPAFQAADLRTAQQNPSRLLDWMRPVVATESNTGRQLGYRVYPGRDPDRFTKLGLLPGDLVTAVNGQPLDDPSRSMELMRNLSGSDNITLTIERDGAQRLVQIPVLQ